MTGDEVEKKVTDYVTKLHAESGSSNDMKLEMCHGGLPWVADIKDPNFQAGRFAIKEVCCLYNYDYKRRLVFG